MLEFLRRLLGGGSPEDVTLIQDGLSEPGPSAADVISQSASVDVDGLAATLLGVKTWYFWWD